ncbi:hypothetical protein BD309DRAFT_1071128 [Dichomitus squalens]|uniref:Uncharacterized protein n=1 Tax=Dichomitus squalens TaxID=114155 RepID=A0A4Q9Q3I1_9APHY|nr:hypothetical protein BD309DRAFT_1071128 [Dichomitus squalens]TBU61446.1 hypothetical protein BD310DRAFT_995280 [Dichomitus squalens]
MQCPVRRIARRTVAGWASAVRVSLPSQPKPKPNPRFGLMRRRCFIWLVSRLTNRLFAGFETVLGVVFYTTPGTFLSRIVALTARRYGNCQSIWPFPSSWNGSTLDPASPPTSARVSRRQHVREAHHMHRAIWRTCTRDTAPSFLPLSPVPSNALTGCNDQYGLASHRYVPAASYPPDVPDDQYEQQALGRASGEDHPATQRGTSAPRTRTRALAASSRVGTQVLRLPSSCDGGSRSFHGRGKKSRAEASARDGRRRAPWKWKKHGVREVGRMQG